MDANELKKQFAIDIGHSLSSITKSNYMDWLEKKLIDHQAKSKEEAQERYEKAMAEISKPGWALRPGLIIRLAAFGKEKG